MIYVIQVLFMNGCPWHTYSYDCRFHNGTPASQIRRYPPSDPYCVTTDKNKALAFVKEWKSCGWVRNIRIMARA